MKMIERQINNKLDYVKENDTITFETREHSHHVCYKYRKFTLKDVGKVFFRWYCDSASLPNKYPEVLINEEMYDIIKLMYLESILKNGSIYYNNEVLIGGMSVNKFNLFLEEEYNKTMEKDKK